QRSDRAPFQLRVHDHRQLERPPGRPQQCSRAARNAAALIHQGEGMNAERRPAQTGAIRIAAVQTVSGPEVDENLAVAARLVAEAAGAGAQLVALPEYFPLLSPDETAKVRLREQPGAGRLQDFLRETARRNRVCLVGGTIPLVTEDEGKVRNTTLVFDAAGEQVARYDK